MFDELVCFVRKLYNTNDFVPLHEPLFAGNEKKYLFETIDSTFVSSVGAFVESFEKAVAEYTGARYAIATVNGTAALHMALLLAGVEPEDEVLTQSLTFVATCNAIHYCRAEPVFLDVEKSTLGLSPDAVEEFLVSNCEIRNDGFCWNRLTGKRICACVPMHTFGFPVRLAGLKEICNKYNIMLVEDAAESLGSVYQKQHTGTVGQLSALSFNGNKIITTGGGGMILTNSKELAVNAKHLTTTAKIPHKWAFDHDAMGYNYRMPNLNAALGVAQMESLPYYITSKREIAVQYQAWGVEHGVQFVQETADSMANYWLNAVVTKDKTERDALLEATNTSGVMTRPAWIPMHRLKMNSAYLTGDMSNTNWLHERLVNVPSSVKADERVI